MTTKPFIELEDMDFQCQTPGCDLTAERCRYFTVDKLLVWKCPEGHQSMIKDINL